MSGICSEHQHHEPNCMRCTALPMTFSEARIAELEVALKLSAERWQDVGEIIAEDGKYADSGFCKATARRCFNVLEGKEWGDPAGIFSATTNK